MRRIVLAAALSIVTASLAPNPADAAILVEAKNRGEPFRMVVDADRQLALVTTSGSQSLIDLRRGEIYLRDRGTVARRVRVGDQAAPVMGGYQVQPWGPGPVLAGHTTIYHVISRGDEICAEMMVADWMKDVIGPVVQAIALMEGVSGMDGGRGCARIPFAVYAAAGWPMLAGKIDHLTFETRSIQFDYQPQAGEFTVPIHVEDSTPERVVIEAFAPRR